MSELVLKGVSKSYGATNVLANINLVVEPGEFVVFVGPSGCGKSTLLRVIAGLEAVDGGEIWLDNQNVVGLPPTARSVAMVFQNYALYPHMTVADNMGFGLRLAGIDKQSRRREVEAVARILRLEGLLDRKPRALSGGQRQRVAIGRAIVKRPRLFLFDEPLSNLDAELRTEMRVELVKLHRTMKATMVYVTHDQTEAMTMADRIVVLRGGRVEQAGKPLELYNNPDSAFVASFIGSPRINLFSVRDGQAKELASFPIRTALPAQTGSIGLRPEHIHYAPTGMPFSGVVELVEQLGHIGYIYARTSGGALVTIVQNRSGTINAGDTITFDLPEENSLLFTADGQRFRPH